MTYSLFHAYTAQKLTQSTNLKMCTNFVCISLHFRSNSDIANRLYIYNDTQTVAGVSMICQSIIWRLACQHRSYQASSTVGSCFTFKVYRAVTWSVSYSYSSTVNDNKKARSEKHFHINYIESKQLYVQLKHDHYPTTSHTARQVTTTTKNHV